MAGLTFKERAMEAVFRASAQVKVHTLATSVAHHGAYLTIPSFAG